MSLYACMYVREFPAQALLRLRSDLRTQPCIVLEGEPPQQFVCAHNAPARRLGLEHGMTRVEVDTFPGVISLRRSLPQEASARAALFDCAAAFSPAIEDRSSPSAFIAVLDITGTTRLHGPPASLAAALHHRIRTAGISASIAVAHNFHAAICLAHSLRSTRGPLIVEPGEEAGALAPLPISVLDTTPGLTPEHAETFAAWGIHTLGALAALPETALIARMGQAGRRLRHLALGTHPHHFTPIDPAPTYAETIEFDSPIEQLESLLFLASAMLDQLILRISGRALAIATITVTLTLESISPDPSSPNPISSAPTHAVILDRRSKTSVFPTTSANQHIRTVRPALPTNDKHLWLKLIHLDLEAHSPGAPILALTLTAEPGRTSKVQMGLFSPQLPDSTRLDVALARVRALVGEDAVGSPVLSDTHRANAFQMDSFSVTNAAPTKPHSRVPQSLEKPASDFDTGPPLTQRQVRPPEEIFVTTSDHSPASLNFRQKKYVVTHAYGPWLSAGDWWNPTLWGIEQWDILARSPEGALLCCCITRDLMRNRWQMVALYD